MRETNGRIVIKDSQRYFEINYKNEAELENFAVNNKFALFGNDIVYFDKKTKITSSANISKIPDGLFISIPNQNDAKLWLVEYELAKHDLERHVMPQILGFMKAIQNEETKKSLREILYHEIKNDPKSIAKIKSILPQDGEIHHFLETILDKELGLVIVVDKKTPELEEVADSITGMMRLESQILEFITYQDEKGNKVHVLDSLLDKSYQKKKSTKQTHDITDWETRLSIASSEVKSLVNKLVVSVNHEFSCVGKPWYKWYGFYLDEPTERKKLFGVILVGKKTTTIRFRIDPQSFSEKDQQIRPIKRFFFPLNTERAISVNQDNFEYVIRLLRYSYKITKERVSK